MENHRVDSDVSGRQIEYVKKLKEKRDNQCVQRCLEDLKRAASGKENTMYQSHGLSMACYSS